MRRILLAAVLIAVAAPAQQPAATVPPLATAELEGLVWQSIMCANPVRSFLVSRTSGSHRGNRAARRWVNWYAKG